MRITVESWLTPGDAERRYSETPEWPRENAPRGVTFHAGGGVWVVNCRECDAYCETFGAMPSYATIGPHEFSAHGLDVPGLNVGILA